MNRGAKIALYFAWLIAIAAIGSGVARHLQISSDLRSFMPPPETADQKLLLDEIGEGPGSRLLLLAISSGAATSSRTESGAGARDGSPAKLAAALGTRQLAQLSRGLKTALQNDPHFLRVANGSADLGSLASNLLPYRYLLS